jgi:hypothetical protein
MAKKLTKTQIRMKKAWITIRKNRIDADRSLTPVQKRMKKAWVTIRAKQKILGY